MVKFRNSKLATAAALALLVAGPVYAATQSVTVNIAFDTPLSITGTATIQMGTVQAGVAETYVMDTAGTLDAVGNDARILYGTKSAASLSVVGSTTRTISITANNYQANGGVTPSAATCNYATGGAAACSTLTTVAAPAAGTALLVGVTAAADGSQTAGATAAPTFDIVVAYN